MTECDDVLLCVNAKVVFSVSREGVIIITRPRKTDWSVELEEKSVISHS